MLRNEYIWLFKKVLNQIISTHLKLCKPASFKLIVNPLFPLTGLGDHQAGADQHRHLPGSQYEPCAAHWIPAEEEAARAEERRGFEERIGTLKPQTAILLWSGPVSGNENCVRVRLFVCVRLIIWGCLRFHLCAHGSVCVTASDSPDVFVWSEMTKEGRGRSYFLLLTLVKIKQLKWEIANPAVVSSGKWWWASFLFFFLYMYNYLFYICMNTQANLRPSD